MSALVDLIKRIGIFMIAAQAVIHFAPAQKYEKYMKLIVGILILLQFLMPVYRIFTGMEWDWGKISSDMESVFDMQETEGGIAEEITGTDFLADTVLGNMENEIKSKLNHAISGQNYSVAGVKISMRTWGDRDADGVLQYEIESVRVVVRQTHVIDAAAEQNAPDEIEKVEKIQIEKIAIGADAAAEVGEEGETDIGSRKKKEEELRDIFCGILGMEEERMEVILYGMDEENAG